MENLDCGFDILKDLFLRDVFFFDDEWWADLGYDFECGTPHFCDLVILAPLCLVQNRYPARLQI